MILTYKRDELPEGTLVLSSPSYDDSIIGITVDGQLVYDYQKMIDELSKENNISRSEAREFIDYNTVRAIQYMPVDKRPIILYKKL